MCETCGCENQKESFAILNSHRSTEIRLDQNIDYNNDLKKSIAIEKDVLFKNNDEAKSIRLLLHSKNIFAVNLMSSPGSGKTSILEKTIEKIGDKISISVIEGDQHTSNDADRISLLGIPSIQINTENGCHLEAKMVNYAIQELNPQANSLLFIENVGNLVCPGLFDIGEQLRVVVVSVTEGDDKPTKYKHMFREADVCIINKLDLLPYLPSQLSVLKSNIEKINPNIKLFEMSAFKETGIDKWCQYLLDLMKKP